jgi:UDP-N-acetylmuramate dehydrogenase
MNNYKNFLKSFPKKDLIVFFNEDLKDHCSFNIGGMAKYFVIVNNQKTLKEIIGVAKKYFILGAGTNILFKDKKHNETFIKLGKQFNKIKIKKIFNNEVSVEAGAGTNLFALNAFLKKNEIGGLEWSYGIPGSVGGATIMNAGAFGSEFGEFVKEVKILKNNKIFWTKTFSFLYRDSSFKNSDIIILGVRLKLQKQDFKEIEEKQKFFLNKRKENQPYGENSAGSVFKRIITDTEIYYPAKIIDNLGLKGVKIGKAEISKKHSGFIINCGNAKAKDVLSLIKLIKKKVKKQTGLDLKEEIIIKG